MTHEKFRRVHMLALVAGAAAIMLPGAAGANVQYMPAYQADALVAAETADKLLLAAERQKQFFKNGIDRIDPEDYYQHTVKLPDGQNVVEYRLDQPVPAEAAKPTPAPAPAFDPNQMAATMGQAMATALHGLSQPKSDDDDDEEFERRFQARLAKMNQGQPQQPEAPKPDPHEPQQDAKLAQENLGANTAAQALGTTVANVAAVNSEAGAVNPAAGLTQTSAGTATDAGNPAANAQGQPDQSVATGATTAQGDQGTDNADNADKNTSSADTSTDTSANTGSSASTPDTSKKTVPSGKPKAARP